MTEFKDFDESILRSKDLADLTGTTPRAIRHYLQLGLLEEPSRDLNGYRNFTAAHVVQVLRIKMFSESGASLKHISQILDSNGIPTAEDIDAIDKELARKEALLRAQRSALKSLKDTHAANPQPSRTAQFDADVGLMMENSDQLPEATLRHIQDFLNDPAIKQHTAELVSKFEALEDERELSYAATEAMAQEWMEFYVLVAEELQYSEQASDGSFMSLIEELRQEQFSPAQSAVWERFLTLIQNYENLSSS
ncbi:helix-turn-helix domain-containing protein [Corynebacterium casei]|uniref:helix-turn-helix domain-containing protein n=3 Tax=Corynebacterium casei TaxID=160386 RepID=UPI003F8DAFEE